MNSPTENVQRSRATTSNEEIEFQYPSVMFAGAHGVEPLAVELTQDAAIEKARKLDPDAAIHVERVRNVEGGGRDKWRRI